MKRILAVASLVVLLTAQFALPVQAAASGSLNYTALGDSLAYGILDLSRGGYVPRYASYVQTDTGSTVLLNNLGRNGWTSTQLLNALRTDMTFRNSLANSQVITFDIGGNDFLRIRDSYQSGRCGGADNQDCIRSTVATFKANWSAIIAEILALRSTSNTVIRTMDIYNPFVKQFPALKFYLEDANNYIAVTSAANNIPCAKVYRAFNGVNGDEDAGDKGYISPYDPSGVHPGELGHQVIADLFRNLGYATTTQSAPVLLTEENTNRLAAVDSVTLVRDPLPVFTTRNFSADNHTRVTLFAANLVLLPNESASTAVTAQAEDSAHRIYALTVEHAGTVPNLDSLTQITVKLPDELAGGGDVSVSISLRGTTSNKALMSIKQSASN